MKKEIGLAQVASIIVIAITEVVKFYNIGKNISAEQIPFIAEMIIDRFGHFKVEDIKLAFRIGMYETEIYDRLDGSILLGWLKNHDAKRDEYCATHAYDDIKSVIVEPKLLESNNAFTYTEYWAKVEKDAASGDVDAMILWEDHCALAKKMKTSKGVFKNISNRIFKK